MVVDDGDIIRGLGFVALYCAYLEEAVDAVVDALVSVGVTTEEGLVRMPTSKKIKFCRKAIANHAQTHEEMQELDAGLEYAAVKLEHRNDLVHGRIYAQYGGADIRKSGRQGVPDREVTSTELYQLANELFSAREPLIRGSMFSIRRAFASLAQTRPSVPNQ